MPLPNTEDSLTRDLADLGLDAGMTVMVHSSLGQVGWTVGGPLTVVRALLARLGPEGTLVMPAATPELSKPNGSPDGQDAIQAISPVFDAASTPSSMGAIAEAFRTHPGTFRSNHPLNSVCARGPLAEEITGEHALAFSEAEGTPYEKLYDLAAHTLLLGVGFNRCTSLHFAESRVPQRRVEITRFPELREGACVWVEVPTMGTDNSTHFPAAGAAFAAEVGLARGRVGAAEALFFPTRALVDFATPYFARVLA